MDMLRQTKRLSGIFLTAYFFVGSIQLSVQGSNDYFPKGDCQFLVNTGGCITDQPYMSQNCQFSCEVPKVDDCAPEPPPAPECLNSSPCCEKWERENEGICKTNPDVKKKCKATCGRCKRKKICPGCNDYSAKCEAKKYEGKCNTDWMAENCRKTCGLCYENKETNCGHPVKPTTPCEKEMAEFSLCMNSKYGQFTFTPYQKVPFDRYECQLKDCLSRCRRSVHTAGCDNWRKSTTAPTDDRLVGSVETSSVRIDLHAIRDSKTKALDCGLETVTKVLQPKIEGCVREKLNLSKGFSLHVLNLEEFLQLEGESSAMMINARTFHLQELTADLVDAASEFCEPGEAKKAKECLFKQMVDILLEIGNPTLHAYREQQLYCKNRTNCQSTVSGTCLKFNDKTLEATSECTAKWAKQLKAELIDDYLECLSQQPGFPPAVADLNRDPSVAKQMSTTYDATLDSMKDSLDEVIKDPCDDDLFPSVEWDTVAFYNVQSKHTTICQRTPKLTRKEVQQQSGRVKRKTAEETAEERAIKADICDKPGQYFAITNTGHSSKILEKSFQQRDPRSPDYATAPRSEGASTMDGLTEILEKTGAVLLVPEYGGGGGGGGSATTKIFRGTTPKPRNPKRSRSGKD